MLKNQGEFIADFKLNPVTLILEKYASIFFNTSKASFKAFERKTFLVIVIID